MTVGERIKHTREQKGITQIELANACNITKQNLYKYENNIITNIPSDKIEIIATKLSVTPSYLMGWSDEAQEKQTTADIDINSIQYAAYQELEGESDELIEDVLDFIKFRKSQKNNE